MLVGDYLYIVLDTFSNIQRWLSMNMTKGSDFRAYESKQLNILRYSNGSGQFTCLLTSYVVCTRPGLS